MKKIISILLVMSMAFTLTACGSKDANADLEGFEKELGNPGTIRVGISPDYPPFDTYDDNNELTGFDVEMANELMKYIGSEDAPYSLELIPMEFDVIVSSMNAGTVDLGISGFTYNADRDCNFSDPYLISAQAIAVNKEVGTVKEEADLVGAKMAAGPGTVGATVIESLMEKYDGIEMTHPGNYSVMFESLKVGAITAVVCDKAVALNHVAASDKLVLLDGEYEAQNMSVITAKKNTELLAKINEAVAKFIESPKYEELKEKYGL